jgi:hypothetical protein
MNIRQEWKLSSIFEYSLQMLFKAHSGISHKAILLSTTTSNKTQELATSNMLDPNTTFISCPVYSMESTAATLPALAARQKTHVDTTKAFDSMATCSACRICKEGLVRGLHRDTPVGRVALSMKASISLGQLLFLSSSTGGNIYNSGCPITWLVVGRPQVLFFRSKYIVCL